MAGVGGGQVRPVQLTGEHGRGHQRLQLGPVHPITDDHHLEIAATCESGKPLHLFLRGEPADEPDDRALLG